MGSMKSIDVKSLLIGAFLASTLSLDAAESSVTAASEGTMKNIWPWCLAIVLIAGQIIYERKGPAFHWPDLFRFLGTLSFAAIALTIALMLSYEPKGITALQVIKFLLPPFIGFVNCYLIAHLLETFNVIKENTETLVLVTCASESNKKADPTS